ncbi:hypothetical protein NKR19_g5518 [Coniochaeta hoffmannii]|uniref:2EXR domain-containing protein n=1 Tax=Coniochaeta hoffmannii TaxID=91930 RepID=A0AA38S5I2_9PEZI|nr:hypothetical protein NKR19_g5518 [Coniochaeta hoffmannii]
MASTKKAGLLNDTYAAKGSRDESPAFRLFPRLPPELRSAIWNASLRRWRIITVRIAGPDPSSSDDVLKERGNEHRYRVIAHQHYRHSELLRVSREARAAALDFYRVHLPCDNLAATPLYINPEHDFLLVRQESHSPQRIVGFLNSLEAYDARGTGVLNLALDSYILEDLCRVDGLETTARDALVRPLSRLRRLWSVNIETSEARGMAGEFSWRHAKVHHNRSVPIFSCSQTFDWLAVDPRPIDFDLGYIATFRDPRQQTRRWQELEAKLRIQRSRPLDFRIMLSVQTQGRGTEVVDRATAHRYLEEEEQAFVERACKMFEPNIPPWGQCLDREGWEASRESLEDAVGFWLFPMDAFDQCPDDGMCQLKRVRNLRDKPPQLCLFDLQ